MKLSEVIERLCHDLAAKVAEALTMGRPGDASQYASALRDAAAAYEYVCDAEADGS